MSAFFKYFDGKSKLFDKKAKRFYPLSIWHKKTAFCFENEQKAAFLCQNTEGSISK
jgi:hypothetical protein